MPANWIVSATSAQISAPTIDESLQERFFAALFLAGLSPAAAALLA